MPLLPCPECFKELRPQDLLAENDFLVCPHCSRQIYERVATDLKLICPRCGQPTESDYFHRAGH